MIRPRSLLTHCSWILPILDWAGAIIRLCDKLGCLKLFGYGDLRVEGSEIGMEK